MIENQQHNKQKPPFLAELQKLGEEIRQIRRKIPMTQKDMAEFAGIGEKKISAIEAGECYDLNDIHSYCYKISVDIVFSFVVY